MSKDMTDSVAIPGNTVAFWKSRGFAFVPATDVVNCTEVTFNGETFHHFLTRRVDSTGQLLHALPDELVEVSNNRLIAAGNYGDEDVFPWYLVTTDGLALMNAARERYTAAMNDAQRAVADFSDALLDPEGYPG